MESVTWVCEDALEEHEWVSPLTISLKEEEEVLAELDHDISIPSVVQWGFLWFAAPARLNLKLDDENTSVPCDSVALGVLRRVGTCLQDHEK